MQTNNKLREAVVLALSLLDLKEGVPYKTVSQKDIDFMKAALAAPPRNCEIGTAEEQERRFKEFCAAHWSINNVDSECAGCPLTIEGAECEFAWAQMQYEAEKGDAKWSKK